MKKFYLFFFSNLAKRFIIGMVFILLIKAHASSQNPTPNAGFENWTLFGNYYDPDNWNTLNPSTSAIGQLTATRATGADVHTGSYAIKLTTKSVFNLTANGIASTGTIITTPPYGVVGGIPINSRPDSITGWYKAAPQPGDTGFAQILLLDANGDTVGFVRWNAPATPTTAYARFSKAIDYYNSSVPTISQWILSSSKGFNQVINSSIIFDDLELITNPVGIVENQQSQNILITAGGNLCQFIFTNKSGKRVYLCVYDITGRKMLENQNLESSCILNLENKSKGLYVYQVINEDGQIMTSGKLIYK